MLRVENETHLPGLSAEWNRDTAELPGSQVWGSNLTLLMCLSGGRGIRTHGRSHPLQRFSRPRSRYRHLSGRDAWSCCTPLQAGRSGLPSCLGTATALQSVKRTWSAGCCNQRLPGHRASGSRRRTARVCSNMRLFSFTPCRARLVCGRVDDRAQGQFAVRRRLLAVDYRQGRA